MTAITGGSATAEARRSADVGLRVADLSLIVAAIALLIVLATGWSLLSRIEFLIGWNDAVSPAGEFTVVACQPEQAFGPDRWRCEGRLAAPGIAGVEAATLIVTKDAQMSSRPYVGQRLDVYRAPGSADTETGIDVVYARNAQLTELARLYFLLIPLLMLLVGSAGWLLGWLLDGMAKRTPDADSWWRRSPLLADLQRRGTVWVVAGAGAFALYHLVVRYVLGSAGVA